MKTLIVISMLGLIVISGVKKKTAVGTLPPHIISFKLTSMPGEYMSIYYIDSITGNSSHIKIRRWGVGSSIYDIYQDSIPTSSFASQYLFDVLENNKARNFRLKFYKAGVTELHNLFIDFIRLPTGGFKIPFVSVDGKKLTPLPPSDSNKYGHYNTGFIYNR